jgi:Family of unknown function (DUF6232)
VNITGGGRRSPGSGNKWAAASDGRTYYRRDGVCVTDKYLLVAGRKYTVADLRDLRMVRGPYNPAALSGAVIAAVLILAVAVAWPWHGLFVGIGAVAGVAVIPVVFVVAVARARRRHHELWAAYRGVDVRVLDVAGGETFGQICRALMRSREAGQREAESRVRLQRAREAAAFAAGTPQRNSTAARLINVEESSGVSALRRIASNAAR